MTLEEKRTMAAQVLDSLKSVSMSIDDIYRFERLGDPLLDTALLDALSALRVAQQRAIVSKFTYSDEELEGGQIYA